MAKKIMLLDPTAREEECTQHVFYWTGKMPCTGRLICMYCTTEKTDEYYHFTEVH